MRLFGFIVWYGLSWLNGCFDSGLIVYLRGIGCLGVVIAFG